jgi:hypothetical protein
MNNATKDNAGIGDVANSAAGNNDVGAASQ